MTKPTQQATIQFNKDTLSLHGDLVFNTVMSILNESLHYLSAGSTIFIDFSDVNHCDSGALTLICEWLRIAKLRKIKLEFKNEPEQLKKLAKVSGLQDFL